MVMHCPVSHDTHKEHQRHRDVVRREYVRLVLSWIRSSEEYGIVHRYFKDSRMYIMMWIGNDRDGSANIGMLTMQQCLASLKFTR